MSQPVAAPPPPAHQVHQVHTVVVVNQKSVAVAYVLWFFLGMLGIHKFYLRQPAQGVIYLVLALLGWATVIIYIGFVFLAVVWIGLIVDLFVMPGRVRKLNNQNFSAPVAMR